MEELKIEPDRLELSNIKAELEVRGIDISQLESKAQACDLLRKRLQDEASGKVVPPDKITDQKYVLDELKMISADAPRMRKACEAYVADPDPTKRRRLRTLFAYFYARLIRLLPEGEDVEKSRVSLLAHLEQSFKIFNKVTEPETEVLQDVSDNAPQDDAQNERKRSLEQLSLLMEHLNDPPIETNFESNPRSSFSFENSADKGVKFPPNTKFFVALGYDDKTKTHFALDDDEFPAQATPHRPKLLHMHNWKIAFSGDEESQMTLSEFLEAVRWKQNECEMTDRELMRGAHNLFVGPALRWYKANFHRWAKFKDLQSALIANFRPADYDERLWDQLRLRTQGPEEKLNLYISEMQSLFALLEEIPSEGSRLKFIKARLNPFCLQNIKHLRAIDTIDELADEWIELEALKSRVDNYRAPSAPSNPIEPNLAPKTKPQPKQKDAAHLNEMAIPFAERARDTIRRPFKSTARQPNHAPASDKPNPAFALKSPEVRACWNCDKKGHIFRDCRSKQVNIFCWTCGNKGVTKYQCSEKCRQPKNVPRAAPLGRTTKGKPKSSAGEAAASGSATSAE